MRFCFFYFYDPFSWIGLSYLLVFQSFWWGRYFYYKFPLNCYSYNWIQKYEMFSWPWNQPHWVLTIWIHQMGISQVTKNLFISSPEKILLVNSKFSSTTKQNFSCNYPIQGFLEVGLWCCIIFKILWWLAHLVSWLAYRVWFHQFLVSNCCSKNLESNRQVRKWKLRSHH